jgi:CHAT domain-containing protein
MARKRLLFFRCSYPFHLLKLIKILGKQGRLKAKTLFVWLFLFSFFLAQGFAWFSDTGILPVFAYLPATVNVVQGSAPYCSDNQLTPLPCKGMEEPSSPLSNKAAPFPSPRRLTEQNGGSPSTSQLLQQGRELYEQGEFSEAAVVLQQAAAAFKQEGDGLRQAMTLSNLSLTYQQLGLWSEAEQAITDSLNLLQAGENIRNVPKEGTSERSQILAQALDIQGRLQLSLGKDEQALNTWQQAAATYAQVGNEMGVTGSRINQAQALQALGLYRRALTTLTELNQTLQTQPDSPLKAVALRSLGDALQLVGNLKKSEEVLQQSLEIAQRLRSPSDISAALFSLGNTTRAQQTTQAALEFYQQAAEATTSPTTKVQAQLNQLSLLLETKQLSEAQNLWLQIQPQLVNLPLNRAAVYARINVAQSLMKLSTSESKEAAQLLATAVQQAKRLGDQRGTAYALGNLGRLYEQTGQLSSAKELTEQSLLLAQALNAPDIAYSWQWQLGRLLKAQGDREGAIAAYTSAVNTLKSLRSDLVSINPDVQFSFRESVEPVYRELVSLLLQSQGTQSNQKNLEQARDVIESLQLAELVNFFREDCLNGTPIQIDQVDPQAVVIYPIVLEDRLEVVLSLPKAPLRHYSTLLPKAEVESVFTQLRQAVAPLSVDPNRGAAPEPTSNDNSPSINDPNRASLRVEGRNNLTSQPEYLPLAQKVYQWLIQPAEQDIAASEAKTLVFVLDGPLLNLPMAVLHDGKQFLVEKYAIALTPGLQLLDPKPLVRGKLTALKAGLTEARQLKTSSSTAPLEFSALPFVGKELEQIQMEVPGELLLNQEFTSAAIQNEIDSVPFPVVHLATHGQFSSSADDTFILTWDDRLNVNQLNNLLRSREESGRGAIELLVLSACQTAAGDERAALGLAGVAVKAGARSTLATLWFVSDAATAQLMTRFYRELADTTITKAEALRRAQVALLESNQYQHPIYWAPYVLVGNWL